MDSTMRYKMAIVRTDGSLIQKGFYNCQEIGLAKGLAKQNIDVDIFMAGSEKQVVISTITSGSLGVVRVIESPFFTLPEISHEVFPKLVSTLKESKYDLIHINEEHSLSCFWVVRYAYHNKIPCVIYQGMYKNISGRIRSAFQRCYDLLLVPRIRKYISLAATKTTRAQKYLQAKGFDKTLVFPVGLDTEPFEHAQSRDWHQEFSIPRDKKIMLYVGVFEHRRNIHFLLDLAVYLEDQSYVLLLAGGGPIFDEIAERIKDEQLDNVYLLGKVPQTSISSLYILADAFLLASDYEIYGMVVLEAMYAGCPVISTCTAGPEDIIEAGVNGFIVPELNVQQWAEKIIAAQSIDRDQVKNKIVSKLTWDRLAERYRKEIIESLVVGQKQ